MLLNLIFVFCFGLSHLPVSFKIWKVIIYKSIYHPVQVFAICKCGKHISNVLSNSLIKRSDMIDVYGDLWHTAGASTSIQVNQRVNPFYQKFLYVSQSSTNLSIAIPVPFRVFREEIMKDGINFFLISKSSVSYKSEKYDIRWAVFS